ncbi:MAG TPA: glycoside hydrolase family 88 protein [Tepidisphaeraceae bacterium]|nr:glycoside hydrolase family 88 protein [Tepidisphaeraceae bacterium]
MRKFTVQSIVVILLASPLARAQSSSTTRTGPGQFTTDQVIDVMRRAADYQLAEQAKTKPTTGWIRAAFYTGVMALYRTTHDEKYLDAAIAWSERGDWAPANEHHWRHADDVACGRTYLEIYAIKQDEKMLAPMRQRYDRLMNDPRRGREDWWWCDALFMSPPTLARLAQVTGDHRYLAYMDEQFWDATDFLFDPEAGLYYRDKNFFPPAKTRSGKKIFWSRGNGWVMGGLARIIPYLPKDHPSRSSYIELLQTMAKAVAKVQREDGLWSPSLLDRAEFDTPETSGSAFFTFAIAWGINHGHLDRATYLPVVSRAWSALVDKVSPEGRLGYVQRVAAAPGAIKPTDTHEYAVGAFLLAGSEMIKLARRGGAEGAPTEHHFDFGPGAAEDGFTRVPADTRYDAQAGYGWVEGDNLVDRDRRAPDNLRADYAFGRAPATFRVDLKPGTYRMTLIFGDLSHGDHVLDASVDVEGVTLPRLTADTAEFATLTAAFHIPRDQLNLRCDSPVNNWVLNALVLEPAEAPEAPKVTRQQFEAPRGVGAAELNTWPEVSAMPDPVAPLVKQFRQGLVKGNRKLNATGLTRADYLKLIAGNVDFFKQHQDQRGAIIDPYRKVEFQYSTPCFAYAAAALVAHAGRDDLLEPAAKAFDWASSQLAQGQAATNHDDFYTPPLARAYPLLKDRVSPERATKWAEDLSRFDPYRVYTNGPGQSNWNVVAMSGEFLLHELGLRDDLVFVEHSAKAQGRHFDSPWGLYTEGPMAYDHFPRMWAADLIASGYRGARSSDLAEMLRRGALTSLFMQSPAGELPTGGRSAHHQWNEAQQCVTYEIYAAKSLADGDKEMAGVFKRAARLALGSMFRWQRPSGELWIVKNRADPKEQHGYETYSSHSQYNLLPMAMLAIAHDYAEQTNDVAEQLTPAEVGGFGFHIGPPFNKVFANSGGMYIELDVAADPAHNATGLLRVHQKNFNPQLGPSEGLISTQAEIYPGVPRTTGAIGGAWQDVNGNWKRLAEHPGREISSASMINVQAAPQRVSFSVIYQGYFSGPRLVAEHYVVTPEQVEQTIEPPGYDGPVRITFPLLEDPGDGHKTTIITRDKTATVSLDEQTQTFTAPGASSVTVADARYPFRNGWARLGVAEFPAGTPAKLLIRPEPAKGAP